MHADVSIHAPRVGRDAVRVSRCGRTTSFNPRAPCGARHVRRCAVPRPVIVSIHAPRVGRDKARMEVNTQILCFNPRAPCGARRSSRVRACKRGVSIHAPRVGRDTEHSRSRSSARCFNPRAPCGARQNMAPVMRCFPEFQSTRPVWGATTGRPRRGNGKSFQSTRPVWGATLTIAIGRSRLDVSIHAPRVGRDD